MTAAMVLCAGLGTRLRPLTDRLAKPMVPVGDRPAVAHVIERVRLAVRSRIVVNSHHRSEDLGAWAEAESIAVSHERELLGTAGGLKRAEKLLGQGDVLVWNGDILTELDARDLVNAHQASANANASANATLAVRARARGEGSVGIGANGTVVRLRGESFGEETRGGDFLGVHVVSAALRERLPETGCLVGDVYIPALGRGETIRAFVTDATFIDIGSIAQYLAANAAWLTARALDSWAHDTATIAPGVSVRGSVIGAGAVVDATAHGCVVWPGAHVQTARTGEVVMPPAAS